MPIMNMSVAIRSTIKGRFLSTALIVSFIGVLCLCSSSVSTRSFVAKNATRVASAIKAP